MLVDIKVKLCELAAVTQASGLHENEVSTEHLKDQIGSKMSAGIFILGVFVQARGKPRRDDVRITVAHVLRVLLDAMPPGALAAAKKERSRLIEFATDILKFLNSNPAGDPPSILIHRHPQSLCASIRPLASCVPFGQLTEGPLLLCLCLPQAVHRSSGCICTISCLQRSTWIANM